MRGKVYELALECRRQSENCLYTSTSLFIWLRCLRTIRVVHIVLSLALGSFAAWGLITASESPAIRIVGAAAAFIAGLLPSVFAALKFDDRIEQCARLGAEFKDLQDRFRQAAIIWSKKQFSEFEEAFHPLMDRMTQARSDSITPPEWCFRRAQRKVKQGDYTFDIDLPPEQ